MAGERWSAPHLAILKSLYPGWGADPVAAATGRTIDAVRHKACALGLECEVHHKQRQGLPPKDAAGWAREARNGMRLAVTLMEIGNVDGAVQAFAQADRALAHIMGEPIRFPHPWPTAIKPWAVPTPRAEQGGAS